MPSFVRHSTSPINIPIRLGRPTSTAPLDPSTPPSPKVRFASPANGGPITAVSRPTTPTEAWSLYHFESHAQGCPSCTNPYAKYLARQSLCPTGLALARDVALHVLSRDGTIYSTRKDDHRLVRVEVPCTHVQTRGLLKALERRARGKGVVSYDRTYPVSPRRKAAEEERRVPVVVETARTPRKSENKTERYEVREGAVSALSREEDGLPSRARRRETEERSQRGSLYESDVSRPRKEYRVEVREPEDVERRRHRERGRPRDADREREKEREKEREREGRRRKREER
ncbi:hypothetical protein LTR95_001911 [Oleoguttula sp. CCFEE 5521]